MRNINFYVSLLAEETMGAVKSRVERDAVSDIAEIVAGYDDRDIYEMLDGCCCIEDIHPMDEFDDVFEDYSAREALEELTDIDLSDDWFDEDSKTSSCSLLCLMNVSCDDIAQDIFNEVIEIDDDDIFDVYEEAQEILDMLETYEKKIENAKALFKEMLVSDVDGVISALWNMNA